MLDFVSDALTVRCWFRILAVVEDFSRENLVAVADTSLSRQRVARGFAGLRVNGFISSLNAVCPRRRSAQDGGLNKTIVSDNGKQFTNIAILKWVQDQASTGIISRLQSPAERLNRELQ